MRDLVIFKKPKSWTKCVNTSSCAGRAGRYKFVPRKTHPCDDQQSYPNGVIGNNAKIGPVLEVLVAAQFVRNVVEVNIDSWAKDGSDSWVTRSVERYVTELPIDCTEPPSRCTSPSTLGTGDLSRSYLGKGNRAPHLLVENMMRTFPLTKRFTPWTKCSTSGIPEISRRMTDLLHHLTKLREQDGQELVVRYE